MDDTKRYSVELTFIPNRAPYCFKTFKAAQDTCNDVNKLNFITNKGLYAKVDPFYIYKDGTLLNERDWTWCIEIVPINERGFYYIEDIIEYDEDDSPTVKFIDELISLLKKKCRLVPSKVVENNEQIKFYSGGGAHIQYSIANLFNNNHLFLKYLTIFNSLLYCDLYNRPYITWLFRQWFDNVNATVVIPTDNDISKYTIENTNAIVNRFQQSLKTTYATYEFRFFDMVRNGAELYHNIQFIESWMHLLVNETYQIYARQVSGENLVDFWKNRARLSRDEFNSFRKVKTGRLALGVFIEEDLLLRWENYEERFQRNYVNRMKHGKML